MEATVIVETLLDGPGDDFDAKAETRRYMKTSFFDEGANSTMREARELYVRLVNANVMQVLLKEANYDERAVAQAVLQLAINRNGAPGVKDAYRSIKRLSSGVL
jgi:uncharacterized NAD-dependent epimerase/dehydratase family protein